MVTENGRVVNPVNGFSIDVENGCMRDLTLQSPKFVLARGLPLKQLIE